MEYEQETWLQPFPWAPNFCLDDEDYSVPLRLDYSVWGGSEHQSVRAELGSLFDSSNQGRAKRVLLMGEAGSGKTTLCTKIAFDWSRKKTSVRALPCDSTVIVLYKLKLFDPKKFLTNELFKFVDEKHTVRGLGWRETRNVLKTLGKDMVIILDGYDELNERGKSEVISLLVLNKRGICDIFRHATLLVTSKPTSDPEFLVLFDKHYSIDTLPRHETEQLVLKYFQNNIDQSEEFFQCHLDLKLEVAPPLALFLRCWASQQKYQDQLSQGGDPIFRCIFLRARQCNDLLGLNLNNEEILTCLFRLGQLCYTYNYYNCFRENILQEIFEDSRLIQLAESMKILNILETEQGFIRADAVHRALTDSLIGFFHHAALEIRTKYLQEEYETFIYDFVSVFPIFERVEIQGVHFPADREPELTFICGDKLKITWTNSKIGLELPFEVKKFPGTLNINYGFLMKCFAKKKVLKPSMNSDVSLPWLFGTHWVQKIIPWFVRTDCPEERKTFLLHLLSWVWCIILEITFDDQLDNRFQKTLESIVVFCTKEKMSYDIEFHFPGTVTDEREFLVPLSKALGVLEHPNTLSTEKLREEMASWSRNQPFTTEFSVNKTLALCTLECTASDRDTAWCKFTFIR